MLSWVVEVCDPGLEFGKGVVRRLRFTEEDEAAESHDRAMMAGFETRMWKVRKLPR